MKKVQNSKKNLENLENELFSKKVNYVKRTLVIGGGATASSLTRLDKDTTFN
jgi:hypothetical protein